MSIIWWSVSVLGWLFAAYFWFSYEEAKRRADEATIELNRARWTNRERQ
jgi:hypothetical protein